jgi:hypothetical protein
MLSPRMTDQIFDFSILAEGFRQVLNYQPWAQQFVPHTPEKQKWVLQAWSDHRDRMNLVYGGERGSEWMFTSELGRPDNNSFYYPAEKHRTQTTVEAMRLAEANLDAFWAAVDRNLRAGMDEGLQDTALWKLLSSERTLKRTPEWIEPEKISEISPQNVDIESLVKPLSDMYFDLELRTERTVDRSSRSVQPAARAKTKGTPASSAPTIPTPAADKADTQHTFQLDNRSFKVFRALFHTPSLGSTPGEVPWMDFLHAMVSTGFEPQKLYGSVWMFSPTGLDVERSIQFHEPHPSKKLPYRTARRFGRRLNRVYGWNGSMFTLKD